MTFKTIADKGLLYVKSYPVTAVIIILNFLMFLLTVFTGGFTSDNLIRLGGIVPAFVINNKEIYRIISGMFLHGGLFHFLMNMFVLYVLGTALEKALGPIRFLGLYLIAGIGSGLAVVFFSAEYTLTIGASGAIWGIIGALLVITFVRPLWFTARSVRSIRSMMIINLILTFAFPGISVSGHIGGLVTGALIILLLLPKKPHFIKKAREFHQGFEVVGDGEAKIVS